MMGQGLEKVTFGPPDPKRRQGRSPSYPAIDLKTAVERARTLYELEGMRPAPVNIILEHWGYSPGSGAGTASIAALKKFGLLLDEGSKDERRARMTDLAKAIVTEDPDRNRHLARLREAALKPPIHADLWENWRGRSDSSLRWELENDRGFTRSGANALIEEFKATVDFAHLADGTDTVLGEAADCEDTAPPITIHRKDAPLTTVTVPREPESLEAARLTTTTFAVGRGRNASLHLPPRMTRDEWKRMMGVLSLLEGAMVEPEDDDEANQEAE